MKYLILLVSTVAVASPAMAEDAAISAASAAEDTTITVVATGLAQRIDQSGQSIAVVGVEEIAQVQGPDITRVLQRLPGVTLTRNGGVGGFTGVRIRGAEAEQTLVLVDGARVADVSSPGSGFDFGTLLPGNIEKIELLRGSNSIVWGSDAIGGVISVTTRQLDGVDISAEYGANESFTASAAAGIARDRYALTVMGGYSRSDGFSQLAADAEPDGFEQWQGGARGKVEVTPGLTAFADARYVRGTVGLDFSFDNSYVQITRQLSGRTGLTYEAPGLEVTAAYSIADTRRAYESPSFGYLYNGQDQHLDLDGKAGITGPLSLVFGATHAWDRYDGTFDSRQTARQTSGHALLDWSDDRLTLAAGVRLDHHSRYGDEWTLGANGSFLLGDGWRMRASYGEGFKAPTLYQLFGFAGNLGLRPERSRSYEAGIEKGERNGPVHFAATVFRRDSRDLIDYDASANGGFGGYDNVNRVRATGFELEADARPVDTLQVRAAYSYVKSANRLTGKDLARRPRHAVTVSADWETPFAGLELGADLRLVGDSFDDAAGTVPLDGYVVATVRASLPVSAGVEVFGRIENVTDEVYQTVGGYNTPGRSAFVGARARF